MSGATRAPTIRATTGEQWVVRLAAAIPVVLVAFGFQQPVGASATGLLLIPAAVLTALLTSAVGQWAGLVGVLAAVVAGQVVPSGTTPTILTLLAGLVAATAWLAEVLVATSRPALAVIPPVFLLLVTLLVGLAGTRGALLLVVGVTVALVFLLFLVGSWTGAGDGADAAVAPTGRAIGWSVAAMGVVAALAFMGGALAELLLDRPPRVLEISVPRPPTPPSVSDVQDPLTEATRWQMLPSESGRQLLTLTEPTQGARPVWLALAVYDGRTWVVPGFYRTIETGVPADPSGTPASAQVRGIRVRVGEGLPGPWVPVPQRVTEISGPGSLSVSVFSGAVASATTPIGQSFDVLYRLAEATPQQLESARPSTMPGDGALLLPGPLPPAMERLAASVEERAGPAMWPRLVALAEALREPTYTAAPESALPLEGPGRTLEDYDLALADEQAFQEQYAAIFALVARSWGVPTRLSIGFLPDKRPAAPTATAVEVRGPQTSIWAEARIEGIGWVAFQPSPQDRDAGRPAVVLPLDPAARPTPSPAPTPTSATPTPRPSPTKEGEAEREEEEGSQTSLLDRIPTRTISLVLLLLMPEVIWLVFVWLRRRRQRARLGRGPARQRMVGAWAWSRRCLAEAGLPLPPGASPDRVADPTDPVADDLPPQVAEPLRALASLATPAAYAPAADVADAATGDEAWELVGQIERACRREMTVWQRLRRRVIPGLRVGPVDAPARPAVAGAVPEA